MTQPFTDALTWMPKSRSMAATLSRSHDLARARGHHAVTLEHLLLALVEDADAASVLTACNIDIGRLGGEVSNHVDRKPAGEHATPEADPALVRILQYAVAAARQSRRGEVNGAIVLAAVVGEGQSDAAKLLQSAGLTFQETVRALQQTASIPQPAAPNGVQAEQASGGHPPPPSMNNAAPFRSQPVEDPVAAARRRVEALRANAGLQTPPGQQQPRPHVSTLPPEPSPLAREPDPVSNPAAAPPPEPPASPIARPPQDAAPPAPPSSPPPSVVPPAPPEPGQFEPSPAPQAAATEDWMPPPVQGHPGPNGRPPRMPPPVPPVAGPPPLPSAPATSSGTQASPYAQGSFFEPPWESRTTAASDSPGSVRAGREPGRSPEPIAPSAVEPVDLDRLAETLPRRMRRGRSQAVEVRILRTALATLFSKNDGAFTGFAHGAVMSRTVTVRLKSPMRAATVELLSPETLWVGTDSREDDILRWRWLVTPQKSGRLELRLVLLMRTLGTDGIAVDQSTPEITVDVSVRKDLRRLVLRLGACFLSALAGAAVILAANGAFAPLLDKIQALLN